MKTTSSIFVIAALLGTLSITASAREASRPEVQPQRTPVVEMTALTAEQSARLTVARIEYQRNLEELKTSYADTMDTILSK